MNCFWQEALQYWLWFGYLLHVFLLSLFIIVFSVLVCYQRGLWTQNFTILFLSIFCIFLSIFWSFNMQCVHWEKSLPRLALRPLCHSTSPVYLGGLVAWFHIYKGEWLFKGSFTSLVWSLGKSLLWPGRQWMGFYGWKVRSKWKS